MPVFIVIEQHNTAQNNMMDYYQLLMMSQNNAQNVIATVLFSIGKVLIKFPLEMMGILSCNVKDTLLV